MLFFAGIGEASQQSSHAPPEPQDLAEDLEAMELDTEESEYGTPPQSVSEMDIEEPTQNPSAYTFWENYRKCPSPDMMGKASSPKRKKKVSRKNYFSRKSKSSTDSSAYIEHSMQFEQDEIQAVIINTIKSMMSMPHLLHEAQIPELAIDLGVHLTENDTRESITQKVLDLLDNDDIIACQFCDRDGFANQKSLEVHQKQFHQIITNDKDKDKVMESISDNDIPTEDTVQSPPLDETTGPPPMDENDAFHILGLLEHYIGENQANRANLDLIHNELLLELLTIMDSKNPTEESILSTNPVSLWKLKKDCPMSHLFAYINESDNQELAKDFLQYNTLPETEQIRNDLMNDAENNFLLELALRGLAISNKKKNFLYYKCHLEPLDRSGLMELAQNANEPVHEMSINELCTFLRNQYQSESLTWENYKKENEAYKNSILSIMYKSRQPVKYLATLITSNCLSKYYSPEDVEYLIKKIIPDSDQVKAIVLSEQLDNLTEDELHEILIVKLAHPEIQELSIDSMKEKILEYCEDDVKNHATVLATLKEMFPEKTNDVEEEFIFENDVDIESNFSEIADDDYIDFDDDDVEMDIQDTTDLDKKAQLLSFKNVMKKASLEKLTTIAKSLNVEYERVDLIGLIDAILKHCVDSEEKMELLVESLSRKDSEEEFTKSQFKAQIDHLKMFNLNKLFHNLAKLKMEPIPEDLTKELEKDKNGSFHDCINQLQLKFILPIAEYYGINLGNAKQFKKVRVVKKVLDAALVDKTIEITLRDFVKSFKIAKNREKIKLQKMESKKLVTLCKASGVKIKNVQDKMPIRLKSALLDDFLYKMCNFPKYLDLIENQKETIVEAAMASIMTPNQLAKIVLTEILREPSDNEETAATAASNQTKKNAPKDDKLSEKIAKYNAEKRNQLESLLKYIDRPILIDSMNATSAFPDMTMDLSNQNIRDYLVEYGLANRDQLTILVNAIKYSYSENGDIHFVPHQIEEEEAVARRLNIPITTSNEPLEDLIKQVQRSYSISDEFIDKIKTSIQSSPKFEPVNFQPTGLKFFNIANTRHQNRYAK